MVMEKLRLGKDLAAHLAKIASEPFDWAAFYRDTDSDDPITNEECVFPTYKIVVENGVVNMVPGDPLKVSI